MSSTRLAVARRTAVFLVAALVPACGPQRAAPVQTAIPFERVPPTVQAAFADEFTNVSTASVTRETRGSEDDYGVAFTGRDGRQHRVTFNSGGDQIAGR